MPSVPQKWALLSDTTMPPHWGYSWECSALDGELAGNITSVCLCVCPSISSIVCIVYAVLLCSITWVSSKQVPLLERTLKEQITAGIHSIQLRRMFRSIDLHQLYLKHRVLFWEDSYVCILLSVSLSKRVSVCLLVCLSTLLVLYCTCVHQWLLRARSVGFGGMCNCALITITMNGFQISTKHASNTICVVQCASWQAACVHTVEFV